MRGFLHGRQATCAKLPIHPYRVLNRLSKPPQTYSTAVPQPPLHRVCGKGAPPGWRLVPRTRLFRMHTHLRGGENPRRGHGQPPTTFCRCRHAHRRDWNFASALITPDFKPLPRDGTLLIGAARSLFPGFRIFPRICLTDGHRYHVALATNVVFPSLLGRTGPDQEQRDPTAVVKVLRFTMQRNLLLHELVTSW